ncbi:hypothetical protein HZA57_04420 [Candidatus Poribacteria bacterium]|nr:hypothetical protein [Candidatus Poribacteria bacterium]
MLETEYGGFVWLPYAILGFLMCVGYIIWRRGADKRRREKGLLARPGRKPPSLETELQEEIQAAVAREQRAGREDTEPMALEPPEQTKELMNELREKYRE